MKSIIKSIAALSSSLMLCALSNTASAGASHAAVKRSDVATAAFRDICLRTAPSFDRSAVAAKRYGVNGLDAMGGLGRMGATSDESLTVQIKTNKECAITTESNPGPLPRQRFAKVVSDMADTAPTDTATGVFLAKIHGHSYLFLQDRRGGEAYVMRNLAK